MKEAVAGVEKVRLTFTHELTRLSRQEAGCGFFGLLVQESSWHVPPTVPESLKALCVLGLEADLYFGRTQVVFTKSQSRDKKLSASKDIMLYPFPFFSTPTLEYM